MREQQAESKRESRSIAWLAGNAVRVALATTAIAFIMPLLVLLLVASMFGWSVSPEPRDWATWLPAVATVWTAIVAAGYFVITAALFSMTAKQAEAAARQAHAAASAAERSALESQISAAALRGTIEQQRLD